MVILYHRFPRIFKEVKNMAEEKVKGREEALAPVIAKAWKDDKFKKDLLSNPKAVISEEFGVQIPDNVNVKVLEENANNLYIILPEKPVTSELSDEQLEAVAGGVCIPVAVLAGGIAAGATTGAIAAQGQRRGW
jgi:hypothetical protein